MNFQFSDASSEQTEDDDAIKKYFENFFERHVKQDTALSLLSRVSYNFWERMSKISDPKCHCELCLKFCEPEADAKVQKSGKIEDRLALDDPWMLYMGCDMSQYFDEMVYLP